MTDEKDKLNTGVTDPGDAKRRQAVEAIMALQRVYGAAQNAPLPKSAHVQLEADANLIVHALRGETAAEIPDPPPGVPVSAGAPVAVPPKHRASSRVNRKGPRHGEK